jgi:SAM-dependent methyltransferase
MVNAIKSAVHAVGWWVYLSRAERRHALVGPARGWQMKREFQLRFLREKGLLPSHEFLDLGCGTLRGGIPIIRYLETGRYVGVESRAKVLAEGKKELQEQGCAAKAADLIWTPRLSEVHLDRRFDMTWAFSVLVHMSDPVLDEALGFVKRHMAPSGIMYANASIGTMPEGRSQDQPVVARPFPIYREAAARHGLGITDIGSLRECGHISHDAHQDGQRMLEIRPV